jgi:hypothetical protein
LGEGAIGLYTVVLNGPLGLLGRRASPWAASCQLISCRAGPALWAENEAQPSPTSCSCRPGPEKIVLGSCSCQAKKSWYGLAHGPRAKWPSILLRALPRARRAGEVWRSALTKGGAWCGRRWGYGRRVYVLGACGCWAGPVQLDQAQDTMAMVPAARRSVWGRKRRRRKKDKAWVRDPHWVNVIVKPLEGWSIKLTISYVDIVIESTLL